MITVYNDTHKLSGFKSQKPVSHTHRPEARIWMHLSEKMQLSIERAIVQLINQSIWFPSTFSVPSLLRLLFLLKLVLLRSNLLSVDKWTFWISYSLRAQMLPNYLSDDSDTRAVHNKVVCTYSGRSLARLCTYFTATRSDAIFSAITVNMLSTRQASSFNIHSQGPTPWVAKSISHI